jgi:F-box and WD-40 domain protein MET30
LLERKRLRASKRQIQLRATGRGINEWSPEITPNPEAFEELLPPVETLHERASSDPENTPVDQLSPVASKKGAGVVVPEGCV